MIQRIALQQHNSTESMLGKEKKQSPKEVIIRSFQTASESEASQNFVLETNKMCIYKTYALNMQHDCHTARKKHCSDNSFTIQLFMCALVIKTLLIFKFKSNNKGSFIVVQEHSSYSMWSNQEKKCTFWTQSYFEIGMKKRWGFCFCFFFFSFNYIERLRSQNL